MNALNEVNKLIMSLNTIQRSTLNRSEEPESLTAEKLIVRHIDSCPISSSSSISLAMDSRESSSRYRPT